MKCYTAEWAECAWDESLTIIAAELADYVARSVKKRFRRSESKK
jgi:hypothetical protein